jgi:hypothetical protein
MKQKSTKTTKYITMKELINTIIYIFSEESNAFTNEKESEIKTNLRASYLKFAEKFNINPDIEICGMRDGLGALCEADPSSYLITSISGDKIAIDICKYNYFRYEKKRARIVIITMHEKFKKAQKSLASELVKAGMIVEIKKPEKPREKEEYYRTGADDWGGIYDVR